MNARQVPGPQKVTAKFLDRESAQAYVRDRGIPLPGKNCLRDKAARGGGPRFAHINGRVVYRPEDLDAWIEEEFAKPRPRRNAATSGDHAPAVDAREALPQLVEALRDLRRRFHAACLATGSDPEMADLACEKADAALKAAGVTP